MPVLRSWWVGQQRLRHSLYFSHPICVTSQLPPLKTLWQNKLERILGNWSLPDSPLKLASQCQTQGFLWFYSHPPPLVEKKTINSPAGGAFLELNSWKASGPDLWEFDKASLSRCSTSYCSDTALCIRINTSQPLALKNLPSVSQDKWISVLGSALQCW